MDKKSELITLRLTAKDLDCLMRAAEVKWPGISISRSNAIGSLALGMANQILEGEASTEKPPRPSGGSKED